MKHDLSTTIVSIDAEAVEAMAAGQRFTLLYLPEGKLDICAWCEGKPKKMTSEVRKGDEAAFQRDLEKLMAGGPEPYGDINHDGKTRSYVPQRFFWAEGKGIMLEALATGAGATAITEGNQPYHSPEWLRDKKTGRPVGLAGRNVGGLVPEPAFQNLEKIAARHAAGADPQNGDEPTPTPNNTNMKTELIMAALAAAGILSPTEASADTAATLLTERLGKLVPKTELEAVKARLATAETAATTVRETAAKEKVAEAVKAGRIAPKDDKTQAYWTKALAAEDNADAAAVFAALAPTKGAPGVIIKLDSGERAGEAATASADRTAQQRAEVEAVRAGHPGMSWDTAFGIARGKKPQLFVDAE